MATTWSGANGARIDILAETAAPETRAALRGLARRLRGALRGAGVAATVSGDLGQTPASDGPRVVLALRLGRYPGAPEGPAVLHARFPRPSRSLAERVGCALDAATGRRWPIVPMRGAIAVTRGDDGAAAAPAAAIHLGSGETIPSALEDALVRAVTAALLGSLAGSNGGRGVPATDDRVLGKDLPVVAPAPAGTDAVSPAPGQPLDSTAAHDDSPPATAADGVPPQGGAVDPDTRPHPISAILAPGDAQEVNEPGAPHAPVVEPAPAADRAELQVEPAPTAVRAPRAEDTATLRGAIPTAPPSEPAGPAGPEGADVSEAARSPGVRALSKPARGARDLQPDAKSLREDADLDETTRGDTPEQEREGSVPQGLQPLCATAAAPPTPQAAVLTGPRGPEVSATAPSRTAAEHPGPASGPSPSHPREAPARAGGDAQPLVPQSTVAPVLDPFPAVSAMAPPPVSPTARTAEACAPQDGGPGDAEAPVRANIPPERASDTAATAGWPEAACVPQAPSGGGTQAAAPPPSGSRDASAAVAAGTRLGDCSLTATAPEAAAAPPGEPTRAEVSPSEAPCAEPAWGDTPEPSTPLPGPCTPEATEVSAAGQPDPSALDWLARGTQPAADPHPAARRQGRGGSAASQGSAPGSGVTSRSSGTRRRSSGAGGSSAGRQRVRKSGDGEDGSA